MGEIADDHYDRMFDEDNGYGDDEYGSYEFRAAPRRPVCSRCGSRAVRWHHTGERWALLGDDNKIHTCGRVATADDFEDVS